MDPITFTVHDEDGNPHVYTMRLHPATEGRMIALKLAGLGIEPFAGVLVSFALASVRGAPTSSSVDMASLSSAIEGLPGVIAKIDGNLIDALLKHVDRDEVPLMMRPGAVNPNFDAAYAGNYSELAMALWEVIKANRFLPVSRILKMFKGLKKEPGTPISKGQ